MPTVGQPLRVLQITNWDSFRVISLVFSEHGWRALAFATSIQMSVELSVASYSGQHLCIM